MIGIIRVIQKHYTKLTVLTIIFMVTYAGASATPLYIDTIHTGFGEFVYTGYQPLSAKPVTVYYYQPRNLPENAPIMILMHGNSRAAISYRKAMAKYAEKDKFLLIVPEFSTKFYPAARDYHQGGVFEKNGHLKPEEDWTFSIIEPLFGYIKKITGKKNKGYILYGFSAGAQFVHRFTWFCPDNRAVKTISASAGSYSMPDFQIRYPYGLKETKIPQSNIVKAFSKDLTIVAGDADTVLSRKDLPKSERANEEGRDRVERARNFYMKCNQLAEKMGVPFNWKFRLIPHVGHSQSQMAKPVAGLLYGNPTDNFSDSIISEKADRIRTENRIPGMQIVYVKDGKTSDYFLGKMEAGSDKPVTSNTLFQAASLSKSVMAYAVLRLYDRGILSLDTPLENYWEYPRLSEEPEGKNITARMVLTHTTGLPNWTKPRGAKLKVAFKPGTAFRYSGEGYLFLQKIIEHLTHKSLEQIAEEEVFKPLGMKQSHYVYEKKLQKDYANGHDDTEPLPLRKFREPNGAYSLITNANDYTIFVQKALIKGEGLKPETHSLMLDSLVEIKKNLKNGLGVMMQFNERGKEIYHTGSNPGFRAFYFAYPATGESIVCFTNSTNGAKIRKELSVLILGKQTFWCF